jgi:UDP-glucose 4-epimerase
MRRRLLITGGTGFFGRALAKQLRNDYEIFLAARNNASNAQAHAVTGCPVLPLDVVNIESVRDAFAEVRPNLVIHAAATKYVDLAERFPMECIDVNVLGSQNVARIAIDKGVAAVIGISTDKAAPPVRNTYGLSKALMERLFCSLDGKTQTKFACVRLGNIAWSTGSVFPVWKSMQQQTGTIYSTGPDMHRFFISAGDAARLVRTAIDHIDEIRGRVLSPAMKTALIRDLLALWIDNKGGRWERAAERPGERADEGLIGESELAYTQAVQYDGKQCYITSFNQRADIPVEKQLTSASAERLSRAEMLELINEVEP